jgi:energy-coupling factor transport system substrate-specific component
MAFVVFGLIWGFLFGWIMNLWHWLMFVHPLSFKSWGGLCATSFYFDAMHACTNALLCWVAGPDVLRALQRFKQRIVFSFKDESDEDVPQLAEEQKV